MRTVTADARLSPSAAHRGFVVKTVHPALSRAQFAVGKHSQRTLNPVVQFAVAGELEIGWLKIPQA